MRGKPGRPRKVPLEVEAQQFLQEKGRVGITLRHLYISAALNALIQKGVRPEDVKREAESWADIMLNE